MIVDQQSIILYFTVMGIAGTIAIIILDRYEK